MGDWKDRLGVVFSTGSDFEYEKADENATRERVAVAKQPLRIFLDKKQRKGKQVTIVSNYQGDDEGLKELGKLLKTKCGVGGSVKDGEIIIQGDLRQKIVDILQKEGYAKSRII